jgi:hypothetical protein
LDKFETSIFINCPFDKDFEPLLQAMLFCVVSLGFEPLLATIRNDGAENRLSKITGLVKGAKYSIHDLSRSQSKAKGEHARMNMPFELGLDYGCRQYAGAPFTNKKLLILEEKRYRHQIAISDLAGIDVEAHSGDYQTIVRKVRNWLVSEAGITAPGASAILGKYADFQEWYYEKQLAAGFSEEDIQDYPTSELLVAMKEWCSLGQPI